MTRAVLVALVILVVLVVAFPASQRNANTAARVAPEATREDTAALRSSGASATLIRPDATRAAIGTRVFAGSSPAAGAPLPLPGYRGSVSPDPRRPAHMALSPRPTLEVTHQVSGLASWFCLPGRSACTVGYPASGMYAAAGPALRVGNWRGRTVTVMTGNAAVEVRLIDWCSCPGRLVDLYAAVWFGLGVPLSLGLVDVEVSW